MPHRGGLCASLRSLCAASGRPLCQPGKPLCRCGTPLCRSRRPLCGSRRPLRRPGRPLCRSGRALRRVQEICVCASSGREKRKRCASAKNGASRSGPPAPAPPLPGPSCARTFPTSRNATSADDGGIPADLDALFMTMARTAPSQAASPKSLMRLRRPVLGGKACGSRLGVVVAPREPCGGREGPRRRPAAIEYVLRRVPAP